MLEYSHFSIWKLPGEGKYFFGARIKYAFNTAQHYPSPERAWMFSMVHVWVCWMHLKVDGIRAQQGGQNNSNVLRWKRINIFLPFMHHPDIAHFLMGLVLPGYYIPRKRHVWQLRSVEVWAAASLWDDSARGAQNFSLFFFIHWEEEALWQPSLFYVADDCVWCTQSYGGTRSKGSRATSINSAVPFNGMIKIPYMR